MGGVIAEPLTKKYKKASTPKHYSHYKSRDVVSAAQVLFDLWHFLLPAPKV